MAPIPPDRATGVVNTVIPMRSEYVVDPRDGASDASLRMFIGLLRGRIGRGEQIDFRSWNEDAAFALAVRDHPAMGRLIRRPAGVTERLRVLEDHQLPDSASPGGESGDDESVPV